MSDQQKGRRLGEDDEENLRELHADCRHEEGGLAPDRFEIAGAMMFPSAPITAVPAITIPMPRSVGGPGAEPHQLFPSAAIAVSQLRADRLLAQARDPHGEALALIHLFAQR
jgi:hypothetical protein